MESCIINLKPGKPHAAEKGHPWIYTDEIENFSGSYQNGDIVAVNNARGHFIGRGFINDQSKIAVRIMTRDIEEAADGALIRRRLHQAAAYRRDIMPDEEAFRLVFGESDFLPGLTIDRYGDYFVLQSLALGIDQFKPDVVRVLQDEFGAKGILERSDVKVRELEGMEPYKGYLSEEFDPVVTITENGVKYRVDLWNGQKTGFFLDQKENRRAIKRLVKGRSVLDCFTHTGSFALNAGLASASSVLGIDISQDAVALAKENAQLNGLDGTVSFEAHNAFDALPAWSREGKTFDVVILDPPAFTKSRGTVSGAVRGYRDINLRGLRMVAPGGYFITCSCSHFMKEEMLRRTIAEAANGAGKILRQVEFRTQSADHPILMSSEESYYLKFFIFQVF